MVAVAAVQGIPEGYKQTEVGVIPEDWKIHSLANTCSMKSGDTITSASIDENSKYPCYGGNGLRGFTNRFTHKGEYSLIGRQGALCGNVLDVSGEFFASEHAIVVSPSKNTNIKWLTYVLKRMNLNQYSESSAQPGLSVSKLLFFKLAFPLLKEQTAIATALSDVDRLITSLTKVIEKKRAIKTAAMGQLLTGKKRLPPFEKNHTGYKQTEVGGIPEDWEVLNIGKDVILKARIGWQALTTKEYLENGNFILVTGTDFDAGTVNWNSCCYVSEWRYKQDSNIQLKENDVLVTKDGTIGKVGLVKELPIPATLNSGVFVLRPKQEKFVAEYLFYILTSELFDNFIRGITAGSTITHLYQKDFVYFNFFGPSIKEQTAIATVLADMDKEIEVLEQRLAKTQKIKQGMMQELLTGRTRLV